MYITAFWIRPLDKGPIIDLERIPPVKIAIWAWNKAKEGFLTRRILSELYSITYKPD